MSIKKINKVVVLLGGRSEEREISLLTGNAVAESLKRQNLQVEIIDWQGRDSIAQLLSGNYDCAFIALHGIDGEDGCIQSLLEILEIPYTGSGVLASALCFDKIKTKQFLRVNGLPVLEDILLTNNEYNIENKDIVKKLGLPVCIKPVKQGSSFGIYKVEEIADMQNSRINALSFGDDIMAEPWLTGPEYTVGILNNRALPSIRIEPKQKFYNYDAKYITKDTLYHCPSGLDAKREEELQMLAEQAVAVTGCSDWARVDFVTDKQGTFYILEVNTVPGLTSTSLVPKAASAVGVTFDKLVFDITTRASLKYSNNYINTVKNDKVGEQVKGNV